METTSSNIPFQYKQRMPAYIPFNSPPHQQRIIGNSPTHPVRNLPYPYPMRNSPSFPVRGSSPQQAYSRYPSYRPSPQKKYPSRMPVPPMGGIYQPTFQYGKNLQKSQTWSEIQKILAKPVYYPHQATYHTQQPMEAHKHYSHGNSPRHYQRKDYQGHHNHPRHQNHIEYYDQYPNPPPPQSRIEYLPYLRKYYDYQPREVVDIIYVPVQKQVTDYYMVEHITDYVLEQVEDVVIDYVPQQKQHMKIEYIPIEQHIVHVPTDTFNNQGNHVQVNHNHQNLQQKRSHIQSFENNVRTSNVIQGYPFHQHKQLDNLVVPLSQQWETHQLSPRKVVFGQPVHRNAAQRTQLKSTQDHHNHQIQKKTQNFTQYLQKKQQQPHSHKNIQQIVTQNKIPSHNSIIAQIATTSKQ